MWNSVNNLHRFIDHNILASATCCFLAGMCFAQGETVNTQYYYPVILLALLFILLFKTKQSVRNYILCLLFFTCGALHQSYFSHSHVPPSHIYHWTNSQDEIVVIGTVAEMITYNGKTSRILVNSEFIRLQKSEQLQPTKGLVQLSYQGALSRLYTPGTKVAVRTKLKRPTGYIGSGVFNYPRFLARKDIWVVGFIRSPLFIYPIKYTPTFFERIKYFPEKIRSQIGNRLNDLVPERAGLYRAILIGDKSQIDNVTLESFKASGVMHILAISGLHMAIITGLTYGLFLLLLRQSTYLILLYDIRKVAAILTIPFLIFYSVLTGSNAPVMRSLVMAVLILTALCINRRKSPLTLLSLAALVIVIFSPHQLFTASFQLSFAAICAILFIFPVIQKLFSCSESNQLSLYNKIRAGIISSLLVSTVACLATLPLLLFYFNRFSIISPLTNLLVEPLVCLWSLPLGIVAAIFLPFVPLIAKMLFSLGSLGLIATEKLCLLLVQLPFIQFWLPPPPLALIALYYFFLILLIQCHSLRFRIFIGIAFTATLFTFIIPSPLQFSTDKPAIVTIIDVGQGSSTLIESTDNQNVLVDCGNLTFSDRSIGEQVVAPLLWKRGIRKINTIFVTHGDADHYNGIPFIVKHFGVETIVVASRNNYDDDFSSMLSDCELSGVKIQTAKTDDIFPLGDGNIHCIHNFADSQKLNSREAQNRGLVLRAEISNSSILLPGDISYKAERELLGLHIESDLLLAAHHGSKTSSSQMFLEKVSPDYLLVSSAVSRKKYFPHPQIINRAAALTIPVLSTPLHGSLTITIDKTGYKITGKEKRETHPLMKLQESCLSCDEN